MGQDLANDRYIEGDCSTPIGGSTKDTTGDYLTPTLSVDIPTVSFSKIAKDGNFLSINFIGEYISGVYKYLLGISSIIAVVMIMVGGAQYVAAAGSGNVTQAKERIKNAVTGFILLMFVFLMLYITNPQLTFFKSLEVRVVPPLPEEVEDDEVSGALATGFGKPTGTNITGAGASEVPLELIDPIEVAAKTLANNKLGMLITSSFRTVEKQRSLIYRNCQNPPGSATCNPKSGRPNTCILKTGEASSCPHTTGRALDIWGTEGGEQCISQELCQQDKSACRENRCQAAVIAAMKQNGFCNLQNEPWHFEKPKMSTTCY